MKCLILHFPYLKKHQLFFITTDDYELSLVQLLISELFATLNSCCFFISDDILHSLMILL